MFKSVINKIKNLNLRSKLTGLAEWEIEEAKRRRDSDYQYDEAMDYLGVSDEMLALSRKIQKESPVSFAMEVLGIKDSKQLKKIQQFIGKSKPEMIESIVASPSHIRDFLNLTYTHYLKYKKKHRTSWKNEGALNHLLKVRHIVDDCITKDAMSLEDAKDITMRTFMAFWCAAIGSTKTVGQDVRSVVVRLSPKEGEEEHTFSQAA